jgi:T-complex protein 1 subunit delta
VGGTIDDSEMVEGLVLDHKVARGAAGPTRMEDARVALVQFHVSPPKTDMENNVIVADYAQMDRVLRVGGWREGGGGLRHARVGLVI